MENEDYRVLEQIFKSAVLSKTGVWGLFETDGFRNGQRQCSSGSRFHN